MWHAFRPELKFPHQKTCVVYMSQSNQKTCIMTASNRNSVNDISTDWVINRLIIERVHYTEGSNRWREITKQMKTQFKNTSQTMLHTCIWISAGGKMFVKISVSLNFWIVLDQLCQRFAHVLSVQRRRFPSQGPAFLAPLKTKTNITVRILLIVILSPPCVISLSRE